MAANFKGPPPSGKTVNPMVMLEADNESISSEKTRDFKRRKIEVCAILSAIITAFFIYSIAPRSFNSSASSKFREASFVESRTAFVHLFEWKWKDIEKECVEYLGPNGFSAVQVSPPNEHVDHNLLKDVVPGLGDYKPWWARYQPVSYNLESRSGTRIEFAQMIETCQAHGVDIYVDLILNHMARDNTGTGNNGTKFNSDTLDYSIYSKSDFNECFPTDIEGSDYSNNPDRVRRCRLVDLPDLNQDFIYVKRRLADFVQDLINVGVKGFRLDAGKHMFPNDVNEIFSYVSGDYYIFSEVIDFGTDAISVNEYTPYYDVTEFRYEKKLIEQFTNNGAKLADLYGIGESFGYVSTLDAVVFVDNHDSQRHTGAGLVYRKGIIYDLANIFLLSWPYGYPKLMSSYYFDDGDFSKGPPEDVNGNPIYVHNEDGTLNCFEDKWVCEHRRKPMANMVKFKNYVSSQNAYSVTNWWTNGFQAIGFSREGPEGVEGYVIINKENFDLDQEFYTGLPDGQYCDILDGIWDGCGEKCGQCDGRVVQVTNGGFIRTIVPSFGALAIHTGAIQV